MKADCSSNDFKQFRSMKSTGSLLSSQGHVQDVSPTGLDQGGLGQGGFSQAGLGASRWSDPSSRNAVGDTVDLGTANITSSLFEAEIPVAKNAQTCTVHYSNGDVYAGNYVEDDEQAGGKRHGYGTYTYFPGPHMFFKAYQGQWREDSRHGYGMMFYRNGSVYVGDWEDNSRQGLGLHFDTAGATDVMGTLPAHRYEGQWLQDQRHGLGAEETKSESYFGNFFCGERKGKGVRMRLSRAGAMVCEVLEGDSITALPDALELALDEEDLGSSKSPSGPADGSSPARVRHRSCSSAASATSTSSRGCSARSPQLWREREIAAFLACLGIGRAVCLKVRERKVGSPVEFLDKSNSEMRREFGLSSPVERLLVRHSLKRLLDAHKWDNSPPHQMHSVLSDPVLGKCILPFSELSVMDMIAQGGYGTVYTGVLEAARERCGSPNVAVKEMQGDFRVSLHELLREAYVMASLSHENVCTFVGVCSDEGLQKHYIISELMDCGLHEMIHRPGDVSGWSGKLTIELSLILGQGICAGIGHLHGANLVHADIKSSNILLRLSRPHPIPKICDFGHAAVRTFPSGASRCGTPHWAAPEVLRSEALGQPADVYSIGVLLWELLSQQMPHQDLTYGQVLAAVGWTGLTPDMGALPEIPADVKKLLRQCLRFAPSDRPRAKDVQRRMRRIVEQARLRAVRMLADFLN